jgi:hypothetical protein
MTDNTHGVKECSLLYLDILGFGRLVHEDPERSWRVVSGLSPPGALASWRHPPGVAPANYQPGKAIHGTGRGGSGKFGTSAANSAWSR